MLLIKNSNEIVSFEFNYKLAFRSHHFNGYRKRRQKILYIAKYKN